MPEGVGLTLAATFLAPILLIAAGVKFAVGNVLRQ